MHKILFILLSILILSGCGGSTSPNTTSSSTQEETLSQTLGNTAEEETEDTQDTTTDTTSLTSDTIENTLDDIKNDAADIVPIEDANTSTSDIVTTIEENSTDQERTVTIYIHGYDDKGTTFESTYGYDAYEPILDTLANLTSFDTLKTYDPNNFSNILAVTPYYGAQAPDYYTIEDIEDIDNVTNQYGGGIPRYAWIIAKYAKHVMTLTGAEKINIVSASMGSLIARWMIEKNVENLASDSKILRWQTIEGVIQGNKLASNDILVALADNIQSQPIDVEHMSYDWIEKYLHNPKSEASSPYYSNILISQISSTKRSDPFGFLMKTTPNDGYQAVRDTYFGSVTQEAQFENQLPTHTYFYQTHLGIKNDLGAWANVATFLLPHKRVRIALTGATVDDIHESTYFLNKNAEIVFASKITSPYILEAWGIDDAISEQLYDSGILPIYAYKKDHQHKDFTQILYDDFVLAGESELSLTLEGFEIDQSTIYGVHDELGSKKKLGAATLNIALENGTYEVASDDWSGTVRVELLETSR